MEPKVAPWSGHFIGQIICLMEPKVAPWSQVPSKNSFIGQIICLMEPKVAPWSQVPSIKESLIWSYSHSGVSL